MGQGIQPKESGSQRRGKDRIKQENTECIQDCAVQQMKNQISRPENNPGFPLLRR